MNEQENKQVKQYKDFGWHRIQISDYTGQDALDLRRYYKPKNEPVGPDSRKPTKQGLFFTIADGQARRAVEYMAQLLGGKVKWDDD